MKNLSCSRSLRWFGGLGIIFLYGTVPEAPVLVSFHECVRNDCCGLCDGPREVHGHPSSWGQVKHCRARVLCGTAVLRISFNLPARG